MQLETEEFLPAVYAELRAVARQRCVRLPPGQTIGPTSLVHEVWLRMEASAGGPWVNRAQFFAAAGILMRNILVDRAREKSALKRGGDRSREPLSEEMASEEMAVDFDPTIDVEAVHEALARLESEEPRAAQLVTLRFFVGMTVEEAAAAMEISPRTARRDWAFARAWLHRELSSD